MLLLLLPLCCMELELELIQTQMAQKPMLRAEVYAHAMRASQNCCMATPLGVVFYK